MRAGEFTARRPARTRCTARSQRALLRLAHGNVCAWPLSKPQQAPAARSWRDGGPLYYEGLVRDTPDDNSTGECGEQTWQDSCGLERPLCSHKMGKGTPKMCIECNTSARPQPAERSYTVSSGTRAEALWHPIGAPDKPLITKNLLHKIAQI